MTVALASKTLSNTAFSELTMAPDCVTKVELPTVRWSRNQ